jgi:hypothetical protein
MSPSSRSFRSGARKHSTTTAMTGPARNAMAVTISTEIEIIFDASRECAAHDDRDNDPRDSDDEYVDNFRWSLPNQSAPLITRNLARQPAIFLILVTVVVLKE